MSSKRKGGGAKSRGSTPLALAPALQPCIVVVEDIWAQCDACQKWRRLPAGAAAPPDDAPWNCRMNPDKARNSCKAPEENYADNEHQWVMDDSSKASGKSKSKDKAGNKVSGSVRVIGAADLTNGMLPGTILAAAHQPREKKRKNASQATPEPGAGGDRSQLAKRRRGPEGPLRKEFASVMEELQELVRACQQILSNEGSWSAPRGLEASLLGLPPSLGPSEDLSPPAWVWAGLQRLAPEAASVARSAVEELSAAEYATDAARAAASAASMGLGPMGMPGPSGAAGGAAAEAVAAAAQQQQQEAERVARLALAAAATVAQPLAEAANANPLLLEGIGQGSMSVGTPGLAGPSQQLGLLSAGPTPGQGMLLAGPSPGPSLLSAGTTPGQPLLSAGPSQHATPQLLRSSGQNQAGLGPLSQQQGMQHAQFQQHSSSTGLPAQPPSSGAGLGPSSSTTPTLPMFGGGAGMGLGLGTHTGGAAAAGGGAMQAWSQQHYQQQQQLGVGSSGLRLAAGHQMGAAAPGAPGAGSGGGIGLPGGQMMLPAGAGYAGFGSPQFMQHPPQR